MYTDNQVKRMIEGMSLVSLLSQCTLLKFTSILAIGWLFLGHGVAYAKTALPVPRFVSLKSSEANVRTGPNVRYPVRWVFVRKGEPVEVLAEFEQWRKIRDKAGDDGWIHESMLSGRRYVIITGTQPHLIYRKPDASAGKVALVDPEVRAELLECNDGWCRIATGDEKGWIERNHLWGVYPQEHVS